MDTSSFDRIARLLGGAATRRAGIGAAAAALIGAAAPAAARPGNQSQCGRRNTSACKKDGDCCNGICDLTKGKTNKDGLGRCRCARRNEKCATTEDCCNRKNQGLVCTGGVCAPPCTALGQSCGASSTACCSGICGGVASDRRERGFAATCCLPLGSSGCSANAHCCGGAEGATSCQQGVCVNACTPLQQSCSVGVSTCCAGSCASYTWTSNVQAQANTACCVAVNQTGCITARDCCVSGAVCTGGQCKLS